MKTIINKILLISGIFLMLSIGIVFLAFDQINMQQPGCATFIPPPICGTQSFLSEKATEGRALFNANCAACHKLDKKMTDPSLRGLVQNKPYPSKAYFYEYVRNEQKLHDEKDAYAKAINDEYNYDFSHQFNFTDIEVEQLLEYIAK